MGHHSPGTQHFGGLPRKERISLISMKKNYASKNCKKNHRYCDRSQYGEIGWFQELKKRLHLSFCAPCRRYSQKNRRLTETLQRSKLHVLTPQEIRALKQDLEGKA